MLLERSGGGLKQFGDALAADVALWLQGPRDFGLTKLSISSNMVQNATAGDIKLSAADLAEIEALAPGPVRETALSL